MSKNVFLEIKDQSGPRPTYVVISLPTWAKACVCRHISAYATRVLKACKDKFSTITAKVLNESHIV